MRGKRRGNAANRTLLLRTLPLSGAGGSPAYRWGRGRLGARASRPHPAGCADAWVRGRLARMPLSVQASRPRAALRLSRHPSIFPQ
jgi:hypothetical protein